MAPTLYKYPHVEDYMEIIAGYRKPDGTQNYSIFNIGESPINLARYDMKVVPSLAEQSIGAQKGYTDKQAKLAAELVVKYERQLFKLGVDVTPVKTKPEYRLALRDIDRSTRCWIENDIIKLRFPYNELQIEQVREAAKLSKGKMQFNRDERVQHLDLTEWNVNWAYAFCQRHGFSIDPTLKELMDQILAIEKKPYAIELCYQNNAVEITNAPNSLIEFINQHEGGINTDNLLRLIDLAPIMGYTIAKDIEETVIQEFGLRFYSLCSNRQLKVDTATSQKIVKDIAEYARATNRFPIYVYEPDLSDRLLNEFNKYFPDQVLRVGNQQLADFDFDVKVIYTTRIPRTPVARIPLMISSAGMMYGGDRQVWIQTAEKVVYFTKDVYNKNTKAPKVQKLS